ncbi:MAG TPA: alpha/beta hydrolase [Candidatus Sulfotelmatobacter sp.]|jgi:pimeloyl-ACP methyl ester carboxylesterase|nr:alpha/beta hydrolase [Candidatus Sulfotelmatobacter sp.]
MALSLGEKVSEFVPFLPNFVDTHPRKTEFGKQLADRQTLFVGKRRVEIVVVNPTHQFPKFPVVVLPGFMESLDANEPILHALHDANHPIYSFNPQSISLKEHAIIGSALIEKASDAATDGRVGLLLHSMSGMYGSEAALRHADKIRSIVNIATAGIVGEQNPFGLTRRFLNGGAAETGRSLIRRPSQGKVLLDGMAYAAGQIIRNPWQTLGLAHGLAVQEVDLLDIQAFLKAQHKIPLGLIAFTNDSTFKMNDVQSAISKKNKELREIVPKAVGDPTVLFDGVLSIPGNHYATASHTELSHVVQIVPLIFNLLETKAQENYSPIISQGVVYLRDRLGLAA